MTLFNFIFLFTLIWRRAFQKLPSEIHNQNSPIAAFLKGRTTLVVTDAALLELAETITRYRFLLRTFCCSFLQASLLFE
jgi:hypothetical protein